MNPRRRVLLGLMFVIAFAVSWAVVWDRVAQRVTTGEEYTLRPEQIEVTPNPPWIHSDIRAEVVDDANLHGPLSILDEGLNERIHGAFQLHPWVARVERVTRQYGPRVKVDVVFRRPACMVELPVGGGVYAVDGDAVLLPSGDFSPNEAGRYPLLTGIKTVPLGQVGTAWGDPRVAGGARAAAALHEVWKRLDLHYLTASAAPRTENGDDYTYDVLTLAGTRIGWGTSPKQVSAGDLTAAEKVARLLAYAERHGSLDKPRGADLDVRQLNGYGGGGQTVADGAGTAKRR